MAKSCWPAALSPAARPADEPSESVAIPLSEFIRTVRVFERRSVLFPMVSPFGPTWSTPVGRAPRIAPKEQPQLAGRAVKPIFGHPSPYLSSWRASRQHTGVPATAIGGMLKPEEAAKLIRRLPRRAGNSETGGSICPATDSGNSGKPGWYACPRSQMMSRSLRAARAASRGLRAPPLVDEWRFRRWWRRRFELGQHRVRFEPGRSLIDQCAFLDRYGSDREGLRQISVERKSHCKWFDDGHRQLAWRLAGATVRGAG